MDSEQSITVLEGLLAEKGKYLLRTATLLTGSRAEGEDLLQSALEKVIQHWPTLAGDPEGYLRRTIYHQAVDGWRHKKRWRTRLGLIAAPNAVPDGSDAVDHRDQIVRLLKQLPSRQRTAVVLRYWEDLSEAEAATMMGCSVGAVKSAVSRGLSRLRELTEAADGATGGATAKTTTNRLDDIGKREMQVRAAGSAT